MSTKLEEVVAERSPDQTDQPWQQVQEALRGLQFGSVTVIVQDGLIVQVERLEKKRLIRGKK